MRVLPRSWRAPTRLWSVLSLLLFSLAVNACGDDSTEPATATAISVVSGDLQSATAGVALASPFVVSVTDQNGAAMSGVTVTWAISAGGGSLSTSSSVTDTSGQAQTTYTAGDTTGTATISATAASLTPVTFTVTISASTN